MKKLGIYIIGTNAYFALAIRFIKKFQYFYKGSHDLEFILFSDTDPRMYLPDYINCKFFETHHTSWVDGTNSKFKNILDNREDIKVDYLYYFDADTDITQDFDDWFIGDIVAGEHYGNSSYMKFDPTDDRNINKKPFDRNIKSCCFLDKSDDELIYCYGAFFGGLYSNVLEMLSSLNSMMDINKTQNYEPPWNDESYLNYYFNTNPVKIIPSCDFEFLVSCKGGISDTRNCDLNIEDLKSQMIKFKNYVFAFDNGVKIEPLHMLENSSKISIDYCYYINPNHYSSRTPSIENVVEQLNCKESRRIATDPDDQSKINRCTISHIHALNQAIINDHFPLLILEDDSEYLQYNFKLENCKSYDDIAAIYLGGSLYPAGGGVYLENYDDNYYRVYNMLSAHAILFLNKKSAKTILDIYVKSLSNNKHLDLDLAESSKRLKFLTPKNGPYFYQNDGLTRDVTTFKWNSHLHLLKD